MICSNCGGQIPDGSKVCSFCETEVQAPGQGNKGELGDMEKRMAELLAGTGCGGCTGCSTEPAETEDGAPKPNWWKGDEGGCESCGGGITGPDKDMKYALSIIGLIVGVIAFTLIVKFFLSF